MSDSNIKILIDIFKRETEGVNPWQQLDLLIIEALIVCIIGFLIRRKRAVPVRRFFHFYLFLAYLGVLLSITLFRRPEGSREGIIRLVINLGFGLKTGTPSLFLSAYSIYNILLFIPFGIITCLLLENKRKLKGILIATMIGFCMSLIIECTQLITGRGMFEVTDLLTNTAGAFIGALVYESITRKQVSVS